MRSTLLLPAPLLAVALPGCLPELPKQAPGAPGVSIGPAEPRTDDDLVAVIDTPSTDADGDAVTYRWAWKQDGVPREDLTTDTVPASETTKGENWEVTVTPNDGELDGSAATVRVTVLNTVPVATVSLTPEAPTTDDDLRAVASATDADGDAVSFAYAWTRNGGAEDNATDTVSASATVAGERWSVAATPSDGEGAGTPATAEVAVLNSAPVVLSVTLAPMTPYVTEDVVAVVEASDADGDEVGYTYSWFVDGAEAQTGSSDTLPAGSFAKHQRVSVEVVPNDGTLDGAAFLSEDAVALNSLPTATGARIDPATATEASTLTCLPEGFTDADGDAEAWTYAWTVNGAEVATSATLDGTLFDKGDAVRCTATPFDGEESGAAVTSAPLTISNTAPVLASASLSNTAPTEGDTLSVTLGAATDADGDSVTYTYAWFVNGVSAGAGPTLSSGSFVKGDSVYVVVTPWDGTAWGAPVTSDLATVANSAPVVSSVTLSPGSVYTNDTLTATVTASDADGDTLTHTYAWYVEGALVQTGASSTLSGSAHFDRDEDVHVVVTPNDGESDGTSLTSRTVTVLNTAPTAPVMEVTPTVHATLGSVASYADLNQPYMYADIVRAERDGVLDSFGVYAEASTCGWVDFFVLSSSNAVSGVWTLEWRGTGSFTSSSGYQSAGDVGVAVSAGHYYAFGWATTCSSGVRFYYGLSGLPTDAGFGTAVGYFGQGYSGPATLAGGLTYYSDYSAPEAMDVHFTADQAEIGDALTCTVASESSDADGDTVTYTFAWDVDGVAYTGATDTATASVVDGADVGAMETWACEAVATDVWGGVSARSDDAVTTSSSCDVYEFGTSTYHFCMTQALNWPDAEAYCEGSGGTLVVINTASEWWFINNTLNSSYPYCGPGTCAAGYPGGTIPWIGYSDQASEGSWVWVTGETGYDDWQAGEPQGIGTIENCADFNQGGSQGYRDNNCNEPLSFICEL